MTTSCEPIPLPLALAPEDALAGWPADRPLIALWSAASLATDNASDPPKHQSLPPNRWSRWTVLAEPVATVRLLLSPDGRTVARWVAPSSARGLRGASLDSSDPLTSLPPLFQPGPAAAASPLQPGSPPFRGGWIGWLGYSLGHVIEPASRPLRGEPAAEDARDWPLAEWHHCPAAYLHDNATGRWFLVGEHAARNQLPALAAPTTDSRPASFTLGAFRSATGREGYERSVQRAIGHIEAGDIFQANLAHRLSAPFAGSARAAFLAMAQQANPWYGAYIERPADAEDDGRRRIIASISPELFLDCDGRGGRVVTRPIKGTRPAQGGALDHERDLLESAKDNAELTMIVDLMRNDLGRICRTGSVAVEELRTIERHGRSGGVLHGVATVSGTLEPGAGVADLLRATFPPGSVTGAPKIRAMQIIGELEPVPRGPYCGSIGFISGCGRATFNVAIRTACIAAPLAPAPGSPRDEIVGGTLDYHAGAGIVAESDPAKEWQETLDKAAAIMSLASPAPTSKTRPSRTATPATP